MARHDIILSKKHQINGNKGKSTNTFVYNSYSARFNVDWMVRNILVNDGIFIIQDENNKFSDAASRVFDRKNYFTVDINCEKPSESIRINPFNLVTNTADIHLLFTNILFAFWDNQDSDIKAMSYLIDAFASSVFYMFTDKKEKQTLRTLVNMTKAINAFCTINNKTVPMYEALFTDNPNPDWIPKKYYLQFTEAAGEKKDIVAKKVYEFFKSLPEDVLVMTEKTNPQLSASLYFKTAFIINSNTETEKSVSKMILTLLLSLIETTEMHSPVLVTITNLDSNNLLTGLPRWLQQSKKNDIDFIIFSHELQSFLTSELKKQYLQNIKKYIDATLMVQKNKDVEKAEQTLNEEELQSYHSAEYVATVNVPAQEILSTDDEVF